VAADAAEAADSQKKSLKEPSTPETLPDLARDLYERGIATSPIAVGLMGAAGSAPAAGVDPNKNPFKHASIPSTGMQGGADGLSAAGGLSTGGVGSGSMNAGGVGTGSPGSIAGGPGMSGSSGAEYGYGRPQEPAPIQGAGHRMGVPFFAAQQLERDNIYDASKSPALSSLLSRQEEDVFAHEPSFFESLEKNVMQGNLDVVRRELLDRDALAELREFHQTKGSEAFLSNDYSVRKILVLLEELKRFEAQWILMKRDADRATKKLLGVEADLGLVLAEARQVLERSARAPADQEPEKPLVPVEAPRENPHDWFYCADGRVFKSIAQFKDELPFISEYAFYTHVNPNKNDFSAWIINIFRDNELAGAVGSVRKKEELVQLLKK
jgi:hypothetical protein